MKIQIQKSIKGSRFTDDVVWALRNTRASTKNSCDAEITRAGDEIEIELTARDRFGITRAPAQDVCRCLRATRVRVLGVDAWRITPEGFSNGCTIVCSQWGAFEDIDIQESEAVQ